MCSLYSGVKLHCACTNRLSSAAFGIKKNLLFYLKPSIFARFVKYEILKLGRDIFLASRRDNLKLQYQAVFFSLLMLVLSQSIHSFVKVMYLDYTPPED